MNQGNHAFSYFNQDWQGSHPQKFKGGRKHDNHPKDQLDNLLVGYQSPNSKLLGPSKRRFEQRITLGTDQPPRPHIRPNINRTHSNVVFDMQSIPKLIKLPPEQNKKMNNSILLRNNHIGESKMKSLENGELKTGIYRNIYKSQFMKVR